MIVYRLFFVFLVAHELSAMQNFTYSRVPSLKVIAAQKVQEFGLSGNIIQQNTQDDVFIDEFRHMPGPIVERHKKSLLARIERDSSVIPCHNRVAERIYTYNALAYMNKKVH